MDRPCMCPAWQTIHPYPEDLGPQHTNYTWWKQCSYDKDYQLFTNQYFSINRIPNVHTHVVTSNIRIKGKSIWFSNDTRKSSSILSVISLKIISSLLKAIFQYSGIFQRCFNKMFQYSNYCSNRYLNIHS